MALEHGKLPDPVARALTALTDQLNRMGVRMSEVEERQDCLEDKVGEHHPPAGPDRITAGKG